MEHTTKIAKWVRKARKSVASVSLVLMLAGVLPLSALATAGSPTLLVNTEGFDTIDDSNSTADIELRFGYAIGEKIYWDRSMSRFNISDDLHVEDNITASGSIKAETNVIADGNITINNDNTAADAVLTFGGATARTITLSNTSGLFTFSTGALVGGNLTVAGNITTSGSLTINDDATGNAVATFTHDGGNATITYNTTTDDFEFSSTGAFTGDVTVSQDLDVQGNMSGDTLTVSSGAVTINGVSYNFTGTQGAANTSLVNDGSGNLTWAESTISNSSGGILSFHAEYPNAVYDPDGSNNVGQLALKYDDSLKKNYYRWTTSSGALNDYDIVVRVRVPDTFDSWDTASGITLEYRTADTTAANNVVTAQVFDTTGASDATSGNLTSTTFNTFEFGTGAGSDELNGTYTAGSYMTVVIKTAATSTKSADVGFLNFVWDTTIP